jgi:hypothetical protein
VEERDFRDDRKVPTVDKRTRSAALGSSRKAPPEDRKAGIAR